MEVGKAGSLLEDGGLLRSGGRGLLSTMGKAIAGQDPIEWRGVGQKQMGQV